MIQDRRSPGSAAPASLRSEAGRRQLTVLFADLVGSTALSERLDPEDMRAVISAYQRTCAAVVERYDGHVAKYMGDGVLAYFGYPQAHEEDPERAVRAALDLVQAVHELTPRPELALQVRVGIATGLVVVGDLIGEGAEGAGGGRQHAEPCCPVAGAGAAGRGDDQRRDAPSGRQPVRVRGPGRRSSSRASPSRCGSAGCAACARWTASQPCTPASAR